MSKLPEYEVGQFEKRPWGTWLVVDVSPNQVVKRLTVYPGRRLSRQYHEHRSEYWTFTEGTGIAEIQEKVFAVTPGERLQVPRQAVHRIVNSGSIDLVLIEIQAGHILSEDDIVRLDDDFGRVGGIVRLEPTRD